MLEPKAFNGVYIRRGAKSCLTKAASRRELELAIKAVARGETYLSPEPFRKEFRELVSGSDGTHEVRAQLTVRQYEVLRMIAEGYSARRMALALNISVKTVESHRGALMERLNIHDIAGLVRYAMKNGLVEL